MFKSLYTKTLFDLRWLLFGWAAGVAFVAAITMALYTSLSQSGIHSILATVPDSLKPLIGSVDDYTTIPGFIGQQIFGPNLYIMTIVMAIIVTISVTVTQEDDRRLQTLLSLPITRASVFLQKWFAIFTIVTLASASVIVGVYIGLVSVDKTADPNRLLESVAAFILINVTFAAITFALGMFSGKRGLTVTVASAYTVACLIISELAPSTDKLKLADKFSLLHYYNNPQVMQHGLNSIHMIVLGSVCLVALILSFVRFKHRNIGT